LMESVWKVFLKKGRGGIAAVWCEMRQPVSADRWTGTSH
jgi:hypothetical protein